MKEQNKKMQDVFVDSEHSDLFSGKAVAGLAALGVVLMAFCGQLETLFGWPMAITVNIMSLFVALPYALNTFYSMMDQQRVMRFCASTIMLLIGWHTVFQATRGVNNSYYDSQAPGPPVMRGGVPDIDPDALTLQKSGFGLPISGPSLMGFSRAPFRPVYAWDERSSWYVVLVVDRQGNQVWMPSVQDNKSRRF